MSDERSGVPEAATRQHGAFTRAQAVAAGWSTGQVRRRVRAGTWVQLTGVAYTSAGLDHEALTLAWAARLTVPGAVVSRVSAAAVHRFPGTTPSGPVHVSTGPDRRSVRGVVVHTDPVPVSELRRLPGGLLVTSPARTALDCLAHLPPADAQALLAWVLTRKLVTRAEIGAAARRRCGRHGTPQLLRLLAESAGGALSRAERRAHEVLTRAGLTGWVANAPVPDDTGWVIAVADVLFRRERVVVEIDGWSAHHGHEAFQRDRRRQNLLVNAGYIVLRFTWDDLVTRPAEVVTQIRAALARSASVKPK